MLPRLPWIAAFIGHVLRRGHSADPDLVFDAADELYAAEGDLDPEFVADSTFGPSEWPSWRARPGTE